MKTPESPNSTAVASSDGVMAAIAIGIPMPIMEMAVTRGARSTAIGRQVHSKEPRKAPAATAVSSSPLLGRPVLRRGEDGRDDREAAWTDLALGHMRRHWPGGGCGPHAASVGDVGRWSP
jgi:hypothetical protein